MKRYFLLPLLLLWASSAIAQVPMTGAGKATPTVAAWTPALLPGLVAWYKADNDSTNVFSDSGCSTPSTNTGNVACWKDKSGNGNDIKAPAGTAPTYATAGLNSKPTVQFTSAGSGIGLMSATGVAMGTGNSASIYGIGQLNNLNTNFPIFASYSPPTGAGNGSGWTGFFGDGTTSFVFGQKGTSSSTDFAISLSTETRWGTIADGSTIKTCVNGSCNTGVAATVASVTGGCTTIGMISGTACAPSALVWNGPISEVVITNQAISAGDLVLLDAYLASRW